MDSQLLTFDGPDVEGTFALSFTIEREVFGEVHTVELVPDGATVAVNSANRQGASGTVASARGGFLAARVTPAAPPHAPRRPPIPPPLFQIT